MAAGVDRGQSGELPRDDSLPVVCRSLGDSGLYRRLLAGTQWLGGGFPGGGWGSPRGVQERAMGTGWGDAGALSGVR